jgi:hypothetical protein
MFWTLLLAHLLADYPLQTDRMVVAKKHLPGLTVHVGIHWVVMTLLLWPMAGILWPYITVVTLFHFGIDAFKNLLSRERPQWVISSYVLDQMLHMGSLILVAAWVAQSTDLIVWQIPSAWVAYAIGLLLATFIWFVSERILKYRSDNRQMSVTSTMWPRMVVRFILYVLLAAPQSFAGFLAIAAVVIVAILYNRHNYSRNWLLIDVGVALFSAIITRAILLIW